MRRYYDITDRMLEPIMDMPCLNLHNKDHKTPVSIEYWRRTAKRSNGSTLNTHVTRPNCDQFITDKLRNAKTFEILPART